MLFEQAECLNKFALPPSAHLWYTPVNANLGWRTDRGVEKSIVVIEREYVPPYPRRESSASLRKRALVKSLRMHLKIYNSSKRVLYEL